MAIKLDIKTVTNLKSPGRYTDALVKGLHIWVKPNLRKYWIFRFNHAGKQHNISLGAFPALGIADARLKAQSERERLESGINPAELRKLARIALFARWSFINWSNEVFWARFDCDRT